MAGSHNDEMGQIREFCLHFDFHVDSGRQVQTHQGINGPFGWFQNIDQALVGANFELIARGFVHKGRAIDRVFALFGWQRNGAQDACAGTFGRFDDGLRCRIDHLMVVRTDFNPDALTRGRFCCFYLSLGHNGQSLRERGR